MRAETSIILRATRREIVGVPAEVGPHIVLRNDETQPDPDLRDVEVRESRTETRRGSPYFDAESAAFELYDI